MPEKRDSQKCRGKPICTITSRLPTIGGSATRSVFNDIDCPRFSSRGNTRKELEIPAERFVYDPTSAKAQSSRDQRMSDESFPGSVEVGVAMTPSADSVPGPSEFDLGYYGWRVVLAACLGVMAGFGSLFVYTFSVFVKPLAAEFGWSREAISSGFAIAAVTLGVHFSHCWAGGSIALALAASFLSA
jgi:hypothetical protein